MKKIMLVAFIVLSMTSFARGGDANNTKVKKEVSNSETVEAGNWWDNAGELGSENWWMSSSEDDTE